MVDLALALTTAADGGISALRHVPFSRDGEAGKTVYHAHLEMAPAAASNSDSAISAALKIRVRMGSL
jgi:hypothetical protein